MKKLLFIAAAVLSLAACLDTEARIDLASDQSGTIGIDYSIDTELLSTGSFDKDPSLWPLPVSHEDFQRSAALVPGLELTSYSTSESGNSTRITAKLKFATLDALNSFYAPGTTAISISDSGSEVTYRQRIFDGMEQPVSAQTEQFFQDFLGDDSLSLSVHAPRTVTQVSDGTISKDKRTARITLRLADLVKTRDAVDWEIHWQK